MNSPAGRIHDDAVGSDWDAVFADLSSRPAGSLTVDDLDALFVAAWMVGRTADAYAALQDAHRRLRDAGDLGSAAIHAFWLGFTMAEAGETAPGNGWMARAARLAADLPPSHSIHGYLQLPAMMQAVMAADYARALNCADQALAHGQAAHDDRLVTLGVHYRGRACIRLGRVAEGLSLLDESMVAVVAGELDPVLSGKVYCGMIEACHEASDWPRARQWTEALTRWCERQHGMVPFTGQCRVHRSEILQNQGRWSEALEEADEACRLLAATGEGPAAGAAWDRLGEMHRLSGRLDDADYAYRRAVALGNDALPGVALLSLARGDPAAAVEAIGVAMAGADAVARLRLLPAQVEILLGAGDLDGARAAADELTSVAADHPAPSVGAAARQWNGAVLASAGEWAEAVDQLLAARQTWTDSDAPYLAARTGELLASAYRRLGRESEADAELARALDVYTELGALPDQMRAADALSGGPGGRLTTRQREVLALLATGLTNAAIADELYLSVKTVDRHVSDIYARLGVRSRAAATAYAYEHGLLG